VKIISKIKRNWVRERERERGGGSTILLTRRRRRS
jgi:hypothetical protein